MSRCPNCHAAVDPEFHAACPECGTSLTMQSTVPPADSTSSTLPPPPPWAPPASPDGRKPGIGGAVVVSGLVRVVIILVLVAGGAIWTAVFGAHRDDSGEITDAGTVAFEDLKVGDCVNWPDGGSDEVVEFDKLDAVPCDQPHDLEVFVMLTHPAPSGSDYPGDDPLIDWAIEACVAQFAGYVGTAYEETPDLDVNFFWPSVKGWKTGDRQITCLLQSVSGDRLIGAQATT